MSDRSPLKNVAAWIVVCAIWGSTWAFIKIGLADLPPFTFASVRFIVAIVILAAVIAVKRPAWPARADYGAIAMSGFLQFGVNYALVFWGEKQISSGQTALLQSTIPLFGFLIAHFALHAERLTPKRMLGLLIGLVGVAIIFSNQLEFGGTLQIVGSIAILLSAVGVAYANIMVKQRAGHIDNRVLIATQMICGLIPLVILSLIVEGDPFAYNWTPRAWFAVFYLAIVGTLAAFMIYYWMVRHIKVTTTQLISLVTPVLALVVGVIFLDEQITTRLLIGAAAILAGIATILWSRKPRSARPLATSSASRPIA
jgi:drug/metabolite transporter (DMT)-like permease